MHQWAGLFLLLQIGKNARDLTVSCLYFVFRFQFSILFYIFLPPSPPIPSLPVSSPVTPPHLARCILKFCAHANFPWGWGGMRCLRRITVTTMTLRMAVKKRTSRPPPHPLPFTEHNLSVPAPYHDTVPTTTTRARKARTLKGPNVLQRIQRVCQRTQGICQRT